MKVIEITSRDARRRARNGNIVEVGGTVKVTDGVAERLVARGDAEVVESDPDGGGDDG